MTRRRLALMAVIVAAALTAPAVHAYLKLGARVGSRIVAVKWSRFPIRYFITNRDVPGVSAAQLQTSVARAFATWASVTGGAVSAEFAGFTSAEPVGDGVTTLGFRARADMDRTLGATTFVLDTTTGELIESDIFLNSIFDWSIAETGQAPRFDVESIAEHEIGHLLGLGHSALGETELAENGRRAVLGKRAVMFPIAYPAGNIEDRTPEADDIAGMGDIYNTTSFQRDTGSISGRVTLNGAGIFGAHVTGFNPSTGELIGTFSLTADGSFVLAGLKAGLYVVRAEPLDDADPGSFFDTDNVVVNVNFKPAYYSKLVAVPAGGGSGAIEVKVSAK